MVAVTEARHRGPHPEDAALFAPDQLGRLRLALEEAGWLLGRGYPPDSLADLVCRRHQLAARQKTALVRSMCSPAAARAREAKRRPPESMAGRTLQVDGFNLLITLEVALGGGVLLRGADGALRDLAGLRGSYHLVEETERALGLLGEAFQRHAPARVLFFLDAPISNSGRLRARLLERAQGWSVPVEAQLVPDPDRVLAGREDVVTSDAAILESAVSWVSLTDSLLSEIPGAWVLDLSLAA